MAITTTLEVAADHPAYAGHFPGFPVLPGAVLLEATLSALEAHQTGPLRWLVSSAKFQGVVRPGDALALEHERLPNGSIRFSIRSGGRTVASGVLVPRPVTQHGQQS